MPDKPKLRVIEGDREALELEALLAFPKDFQKFVAFARTLAKPANAGLALVQPGQEQQEEPNRPPTGGQN